MLSASERSYAAKQTTPCMEEPAGINADVIETYITSANLLLTVPRNSSAYGSYGNNAGEIINTEGHGVCGTYPFWIQGSSHTDLL